MVSPASAATLWEVYVKHFDFSQLGWLFDAFMVDAKYDLLQNEDVVADLITGWLDHHWSGALAVDTVDPAILRAAMVNLGAAVPMNFTSFVDVLHHYVALHLSREPHAGFPPDSIQLLQDSFDRHNLRGEQGLKGKALFAVLDDLGIAFHSKEERQWYVQTVKRLDTDKNGAISFPELCQIMRVVIDNADEKARMREFNLVKTSGLPFDEAEDWNILFQTTDEEGRGELELPQLKTMMTNIGMTWDKEFSDTVHTWLHEVDENNNGALDFGEFCILVSKLWGTNYRGIRTACRKFLKKDLTVSLKTVHGTFISATRSGDVFAKSRDVGEDETFTMMMQSSTSASFKSSHGTYIIAHDETIRAQEERAGTQFKMQQQEDDRVIFVASTPFGGALFATADGRVACSDGNPNDLACTLIDIVKIEDLQKKCWSRIVPKRRPSKIKTTGKLGKPAVPPFTPVSPSCVAEMDAVLVENAVLSGRLQTG